MFASVQCVVYSVSVLMDRESLSEGLVFCVLSLFFLPPFVLDSYPHSECSQPRRPQHHDGGAQDKTVRQAHADSPLHRS